MRIFNILAASAATLMLGGAALAEDKPAEKREKKICRTETPAVGRIPEKRVCRTKSEWEALSAESQRDAARTVRSAKGS